MQETPQNTANGKNDSGSVTRNVIGVQFSRAGKIEFYLSGGIELKLHDMVVVKGEGGDLVGTVIIPPKDLPANEVATNMKAVERKATAADIDRHNENIERAMKTFDFCEKKIIEKALPMKLIDVSVEGGKAVFFFFAEERVDFRALVKDLASSLHMRIEMRQIGARDAAKGVGAIGPCGQVCCCNKHLREFNSISISMAKNQGLSPNPAKLTGMCEKLKCCLHYENECYLSARKELPPVGSAVETPKGKGMITSLDVPRGLCTVRVGKEDEVAEEVRFSCSECKVLNKPKKFEKEEKGAEEKEYEKLEG